MYYYYYCLSTAKITINYCVCWQYVQYKHHIPDMKEFTLCAWHKLYNHSGNHPIFSYAREYYHSKYIKIKLKVTYKNDHFFFSQILYNNYLLTFISLTYIKKVPQKISLSENYPTTRSILRLANFTHDFCCFR